MSSLWKLKLSCDMKHMSTTHLKHKLTAFFYQEVHAKGLSLQDREPL